MKKIIQLAIGFLLVILSFHSFANYLDENSNNLNIAPPTPTDTLTIIVKQDPDFACADQCTFYIIAYPYGSPGTILGYTQYNGPGTTYYLPISIHHPAYVCVSLIAAPGCTCSFTVIPDCQNGPPFNIFRPELKP